MQAELDMLYFNIYDAIKRDDLVTFSALTTMDKTLSVSLGRFPILSLCYMYNSKNIIAMYEDRLIKIGNYVRVAEPFEAYEYFRKYAKKTLRLYMNEESIVTPIEMLAILNKIDYLTKVYADSHKNNVVFDNIEYIFKVLHKEKAEVNNITFTIKNRKLKKSQMRFLTAFSIISFLMIICMSAVLILQPIFIGMGTKDKPYMVYSAKQLESALKTDKHYKLGSNIKLDSWDTIEAFSGVLDGCGYTITIKSVESEFVRILHGTIKNVKFNITDTEIGVDGNKSIVVLSNATTGVIDNVDVKIKTTFVNDNLLGGTNDTFIVSTLCYENLGEIKKCDMDIDYTYISNGVTNMYLAGLVGVNYASIENCKTTSGSKILAQDVDVAGLVAFNHTLYNAFDVYQHGMLSGLSNNASITVNSVAKNWSPVVAGVCIENRGYVSYSDNHGSIEATENNNSTENISINVAGVVALNYFQLTYSYNAGAISVEGYTADIRVGGVVATGNSIRYPIFINPNRNSIVSSCYNVGNISTTNHSETKYSAIGGIMAVGIVTVVENNYSVYLVNNSSSVSYIGAICGLLSDLVANHSSPIVVGNVYYMVDKSGIGAIYQYESSDLNILLQGVDGEFSVGLTSLDALKAHANYWE